MYPPSSVGTLPPPPLDHHKRCAWCLWSSGFCSIPRDCSQVSRPESPGDQKQRELQHQRTIQWRDQWSVSHLFSPSLWCAATTDGPFVVHSEWSPLFVTHPPRKPEGECGGRVGRLWSITSTHWAVPLVVGECGASGVAQKGWVTPSGCQ